MISGFIILKNVLTPGYPFVEAIASVLPVCDELLISEGYSTDGTYEIVKKISESNKKIKLFRQEWPREKRETVLADVTNWIRAKCSYDYIFSIQANEIVHEDSVRYIRALPEMCPEVQTFSFPFMQLLRNYRFSEEFRLRFAKNLPEIIATGDAWSLGASKAFVRSEAFKGIKNPRKLLRYIGRGVQWTYANTCGGNLISRAFSLPKPIFRYWSLFPQNFIEKCSKHKEMFNLQRFTDVINNLQDHVNDDSSSFWKMAAEPLKSWPLGFKYPEDLGEIDYNYHPRIMRSLLSDSTAKSYYVREELFDLIAKI